MGFTAENLLRLAVVVNELESRGEDLKHLRIGLLPILRKIASGKLLAEAVVAFAGQPALLQRVAAMPLEEQKQVVAQGYLPPPEPKQASHGKAYTNWNRDPEDEEACGQPVLRRIANQGSEKDVAEMVLELLTGGDNMLGVFREVLLLLRAKDLSKGRDLPMSAVRKVRADEASLKRAVAAALKELGA